MKKPVTIYSKFCVSCLWPEDYERIKCWSRNSKRPFRVRRTAYRPDWHRTASELYGSELYETFAIWPNGKIQNFPKFLEGIKAKPVVGGKAKSDVQRLRKTPRPNRASRVARKEKKTEKTNETGDEK